jgi:hypothetical protein
MLLSPILPLSLYDHGYDYLNNTHKHFAPIYQKVIRKLKPALREGKITAEKVYENI